MLQVAASFPGISRSGITMVGGLWRGLSHEDAARFAARFAFLLATPVILAAGERFVSRPSAHQRASITRKEAQLAMIDALRRTTSQAT